MQFGCVKQTSSLLLNYRNSRMPFDLRLFSWRVQLLAAESRIGNAKERMASLNAEAAELKQREELVARERRHATRSVQHAEAEVILKIAL